MKRKIIFFIEDTFEDVFVKIKSCIEKWYVLFMMMRIARHNRIRIKFEEKYKDEFEDYGQDLEYMTLEKYYEKDGKLYQSYDINDKKYKSKVASRPQRDDFGLYEYVDQHCGYCEDDYYGTIWTKTPILNWWLERSYHC